MSQLDDFLAWVQTRHRDAEVAILDGDPEPRRAVWSHHDPVTLFGAWYTASGWDDVSGVFGRLGTVFSDHVSFEREMVAADVSGDLAYTVWYEQMDETSSMDVNGRRMPAPSIDYDTDTGTIRGPTFPQPLLRGRNWPFGAHRSTDLEQDRGHESARRAKGVPVVRSGPVRADRPRTAAIRGSGDRGGAEPGWCGRLCRRRVSFMVIRTSRAVGRRVAGGGDRPGAG